MLFPKQTSKWCPLQTLLAILIFHFSLFSFLFSSCAPNTVPITQSSGVVNPFPGFRDVPGITLEEIAAIEKLQLERSSFIYGRMMSIETFLNHNGEIGGFSTLFCKYLTKLFEIPFETVEGDLNVLIEGLNDHSIDFMGNLAATEERLKIYKMTDSIAERQLIMMRLRGSYSLERIALERLPRYAFLRGSNNTNMVTATMKPGSYEFVTVSNTAEAHQALLDGRADAYIEANTSVDLYSAPDVYTELFFPLIFIPASLTTANPALEPIISVVNKALRNGAIHYVNYLNNLGLEEYKIEKFHSQLTLEERVYLQTTPTVPMVSRYYNYPVGFYNTYEHQWEGIAFDVLAEISKFTGLKFQVVNNENEEVVTLVERLDDGRAYLIPDIPYSESIEGKTLWSQNNFISNQYALLSKTEFPNISLNEIANARIGLIATTLPAEMFRTWFPGASNTKMYASDSTAFRALDSGEIDLLMATKNRLLSIINYYELPNYKANYLFNNYESSFAFNKNQEILRSIIDKALPLIDTATIVEQWMTKTYDYRAKVAEERLPLLIGAVIMAVTVLIMVLVMFIRGLGTRKQLGKLVTEKTSSLTAILDSTPDLIFQKDTDARFTECNKATEKFFNVSKESIIGKQDSEAFGWPPEVAAVHLAKDKKVFNDRQVFVAEENVTSADRKEIIFETIRTPLIQDGEITGLVVMARDITQRKTAEDEAKRASAEAMAAYAEAENASQAKSRFIANMSHEIRTPMNAILGITEIILRNETLPEDITEALYKIHNSGDLLLYIINDILDLSKIEAGKLEIMPAQYDIASMINDTVMLNVMRIGSKPIEFRLSVDENIPIRLIGDELRIKQILNNIISNAIKYTFKGEVKLTVSAEKTNDESSLSAKGTVAIMFSISDTGQGMTQEQVNKMFDEYSRFNADANRTTEGAGLGMSITQNLVRMMKGNICVDSEPDKGTTVTVRLPQVNVGSGILGKELAGNLAKFEKSAIRQIKKAQIVFEPMPYGSVLLVDDVESNLFVAEGLMIPYGLAIETVLSGFEAIDKIKEGKTYDIVFMDHMMPKMDGIETTKKLREMGYTAPIVALTANAITGQSDVFMQNGFDGFISKPIDIRQLNAILKKFVRDKQPPEIIEAANRNKKSPSTAYLAGTQVGINPKLAEIFARDASKLAKTLEEIQANGIYGEEEMRTYTISVHALKSALTNVREVDLASIAAMLEQAGRERNITAIKSETRSFLDSLWSAIEKHRPRQEDNTADETANLRFVVEDRAFLQEKLQIIKNACDIYDRKTIKKAITVLQQKEWTGKTRKLLATIDEELLNGDFAAVAKAAEHTPG
jgi:PAS domain S-box-containing protein